MQIKTSSNFYTSNDAYLQNNLLRWKKSKFYNKDVSLQIYKTFSKNIKPARL